MILEHFLLETNEANAFLLACEHTREALLVDAGEFNPRIAAFIGTHRLRLAVVFITHDHHDHTGGLDELCARYRPEVWSGAGRAVGGWTEGSHLRAGCSARKAQHGETLRIGRLEGTVLSTPGHTPDSISLAFPGVVFTGDALFSGSIGGTASAADKQREIDHLRQHILTLPGDYELHTGHGPSSTVEVERTYNPFLAL